MLSTSNPKTHIKCVSKHLFRMLVLTIALFIFQCESFAQQGTLTDNATFPASVSALTVQGSSATEGSAVSFVKFKLTPNLPPATPGGFVAKATLTLYVVSLNTSGSFNVYRVTSPWAEGDTTAPTYDAANPVIIGVPVTSANSYVTVDLTALAQQWLGTDGLGTGGLPNYGIALVANTTTTAFLFDSKESTTTSHPARLAVLLNHAATADIATDFTGTLAGDVIGTQNATIVSSVGSQSAANVANSTIAANSATNNNTPGTIVKRDASGNFSAGTIVGSITGNAATATNTTNATNADVAKSLNRAAQDADIVSPADGQVYYNTTSNVFKVFDGATSTWKIVDAGTASTLSSSATISGSQVGGDIPGRAASITGTITGNQVSSTVAEALHAANADNATNAVNATTAGNASAVTNGVYTVGDQTIEGNKTFTSPIVGSITGNAATATNATNATNANVAKSLNRAVQDADIVSPADGQVYYNTTSNVFKVFDGATSTWKIVDAGTASTLSSSATISGSQVGGDIPGRAASITGTITGNQVSSTVAEALHATNADNATNATTAGNAAAVTNGVYTVGDQTVEGNKTFTNPIVGSITGNAATATNTTNATNADVAKSLNRAAQDADIVSPADGQVYYNTTSNVFKVFDGATSTWKIVDAGNAAALSSSATISGNQVSGELSNTTIAGSAVTGNIAASQISGNITNATIAGYVTKVGDTMTGTLNLPANGLRAGTNQLLLSGNNVGIGTASPGALLDVGGFIRTSNGVESNAAATMQIGTRQAQALQFFTGNSVKVHITTDGRVGIGTISPNNKIQVPALIEFNNGSANTFLGTSAGNYANVTGLYNSGVGYHSLLAITTGGYNTAVGGLALSSDTTGDANTAIGYASLTSNTAGRVNTAIGAAALAQNTTGSYNLAIGVESLSTNTTGGSNAAVGPYDVMYSNTSGSNNTALGYAALYHNTTASSNVAVGNAALYQNTIGSENVVVGGQALRNSTTGSQNVVLGSQAGWDVTTGSDNIFVGFAVRNVTTGSRNIVIGDNIYAPQPSADNQLNIGNLIFGTGLDGTGSNISSGNIGIGTNTPQSTLQVNGYVQLALTGGPPPSADCDAPIKYGRMKVDATNDKLYLCTSTGWKSTTLMP